MAFRRKRKVSPTYDDPESLFRDRRNRTVQGPLSHQSDILRRYQKEAFEKPNVALELPTGSGKTLVGLLIAEFRRVTKSERVLYLCPTKQLVLQVCEQSERKYGITAVKKRIRIKKCTIWCYGNSFASLIALFTMWIIVPYFPYERGVPILSYLTMHMLLKIILQLIGLSKSNEVSIIKYILAFLEFLKNHCLQYNNNVLWTKREMILE